MSDEDVKTTATQRKPRGTVAISKGAAGTFGVGTTALVIGIVWQSGLFASSDRVGAIEANQVRMELAITSAENRIIGHFDKRMDTLEKTFGKYEDRQTKLDDKQDRWIENLEFVVGIKPHKDGRNNKER